MLSDLKQPGGLWMPWLWNSHGSKTDPLGNTWFLRLRVRCASRKREKSKITESNHSKNFMNCPILEMFTTGVCAPTYSQTTTSQKQLRICNWLYHHEPAGWASSAIFQRTKPLRSSYPQDDRKKKGGSTAEVFGKPSSAVRETGSSLEKELAWLWNQVSNSFICFLRLILYPRRQKYQGTWDG